MKTVKQKTLGLVTATFLIAMATLQSCKPESPQTDDNEVITTLSVIATDSTTGSTQTFTFRDLDGTGSNAPVQFDSIRLATNTTYHIQLFLLDETKNPIDTVSNEIAEKADEHIFFFTPTPSTLVNVTINDHDSHNLPVGLLSTWHTGSAGNGNIAITLRHQPGVKDGTYAPGDTDVEVDFTLEIQ